MNHDQNKKTLRQFQCRDYLWEIFEQMSAELECSVDYLINEAMRQYARSRNYGVRTPGPGSRPDPSGIPAQPALPSAPPPPPARGAPAPSYSSSFGAPPPSSPGYPPPPAPRPSSGMASGGYGAPGGYAAPPPPRPAAPSSYPPPPATQRPPSYGGAAAPPPMPYAPPSGFGGPPQGAPPPLPGAGMAGPPMGHGQLTPLFVIFNGQKFPVAKEEFIIGRGTKTADLPIKDGNISRRHAAVIWQNGGWYMKDLGSTNGVEFQGRRVDTKRIEEGDVYQLCDYEIRFTYR